MNTDISVSLVHVTDKFGFWVIENPDNGGWYVEKMDRKTKQQWVSESIYSTREYALAELHNSSIIWEA